jgi:methylase of polypeptide subunit release factors
MIVDEILEGARVAATEVHAEAVKFYKSNAIRKQSRIIMDPKPIRC